MEVQKAHIKVLFLRFRGVFLKHLLQHAGNSNGTIIHTSSKRSTYRCQLTRCTQSCEICSRTEPWRKTNAESIANRACRSGSSLWRLIGLTTDSHLPWIEPALGHSERDRPILETIAELREKSWLLGPICCRYDHWRHELDMDCRLHELLCPIHAQQEQERFRGEKWRGVRERQSYSRRPITHRERLNNRGPP